MGCLRWTDGHPRSEDEERLKTIMDTQGDKGFTAVSVLEWLKCRPRSNLSVSFKAALPSSGELKESRAQKNLQRQTHSCDTDDEHG